MYRLWPHEARPFQKERGVAGPALWSFLPTMDTQALLPSSLGPGACYLGAPAGFLSRGKRWWLCAVASPRTWGPEVVLCNLRRPDSAQGPSGFLPTFMALPLRILGRPGPPHPCCSPPPPPPRGGRALPHLGDTPGSSPDLPKPQSPSPPPPRLEVVFPTERGVRGEVSPAPCDRCSAQSHCLPWCEGRCGQG